jgi:hypothetical protein
LRESVFTNIPFWAFPSHEAIDSFSFFFCTDPREFGRKAIKKNHYHVNA